MRNVSSVAVNEAVNVLKKLNCKERTEVIQILNSTWRAATNEGSAGLHLPLTKRQQDILTLFAHGYTRREIGESLSISVNTVSSHIKNIYGRLDIVSKADATRIAVTHGLLQKYEEHSP